MFGNRKNQNAGSNSNQIQGDNVTVIVGIDEKRAREIYSEMTVQFKKEYTAESLMVANARIIEFENKLLPKMEAVDGALESFADPSFQLLLIEAQKTAAATERPADYDVLAELLVHRFKNNKDRNIRAGINRAVQVVDEIADDALLALTIFHSMTYFVPSVGDIDEGLDILDDLFSKIFYDELPKENEWYEHLEILNAIRINYYSESINIEKLWIDKLHGYIDVGIEKNSEDYVKALQILSEVQLSTDGLLVDHTLNHNFVRVNRCNIRGIEHLQKIVKVNEQGEYKVIMYSDIEKDAVRELFNLYKKDEIIRQENLQLFRNKWDERENLKKIRLWWDNINLDIKLTSVGKVLAHANAQRCVEDLPELI